MPGLVIDRFGTDADGRAMESGAGGCSVAPDTEAAMRTTAPPATKLLITSRTLAFAPPGEVAQLVEHATENRGVASSILALGTIVKAVVAFFERKWLSW